MTLGMALSWAGIIRAQNGDLPGALAALQEAMAQRHAEGNRLFLGMTLQIAAAVLARFGQAEPAAVLAGAFSAHFPPDISAVHQDERLGIGEAQSLARRALGEAAYSGALARGAAMDDHEVVAYAQDEYRRLASMRAEPGAPAPESPPGPGATDPPGMTVLPGTGDVPQHSGRSGPTVIPASLAGGDRPARRQAGRCRPGSGWCRRPAPGAPKYSLRCQRCQLHAIATRSRGLQNWPICARPLARMALASAMRNRRSDFLPGR